MFSRIDYKVFPIFLKPMGPNGYSECLIIPTFPDKLIMFLLRSSLGGFLGMTVLHALIPISFRPLIRQMDFEEKFEAERISRLEREGRILKQLADHEQDVTKDFDSERVRPNIGL